MMRFPAILPLLRLLACVGVATPGVAQVSNGAWVYPSSTGNLLYQLDERGQRIADFSHCGYRGGTEPLPNVTALIPPARWVYVSPGTGDDTALIQAAIDAVEAMTPDANGWRGVVFLNAGEYQLASGVTIEAGGVVLKGAGDSPTTGTRLRATDPRDYNVISINGPGSRTTVSGTTHNLTQKLVPAGARTFEVDRTSGLAVGHTVIVKRPSTANWIADMDMDQLGPAPVVPWTAGSKDLSFDRVITRIDGNWITVDVPLPSTFETIYGSGQIWRYTWSNRIEQVGIEDLYGFSDYVSSTDELHPWKFIQINDVQHCWVREITAQYFAYSAVSAGSGTKWLTVADSQCLDPISQITGGRRYSFNNDGAQCALFVNCYAREGRHDFVFGAGVAGPNAFVHSSTGNTTYSDTGPHHRWAVGGLFDCLKILQEINVQNRGNYGTGHGWAGGYMAVWNSEAIRFRVRNPPTARNWLVGSIGTISPSADPVGADPEGTYDSSGPSGTGKAVYPRSLYYGQLQQRLKGAGSVFPEVWLGDVDQHSSAGGTGEAAAVDPAWLAQVQAIDATPADALFDKLTGNRRTAFTFDFTLDPSDIVVAASLTVSLRAIGANSGDDDLRMDSTASVQSFASLGWTPISTTAPTVRTIEVSPALLADGRLNVAVGNDSAVDFAVLYLQVKKAPLAPQIVTLLPVADAYVQGGVNANSNFGTATSLQTKEITVSDTNREAFLRWNLSGVSGRLVDARVRLAGTAASQIGNESCATFVPSDTWSETTLTFNNKPAAGKLFAQWMPVTGQPVEFNVTPQVAEALLGDGLLSLRVVSTGNYGGSGTVSYASRENSVAANRPQLILTFDFLPPEVAITSPADGALIAGAGALTITADAQPTDGAITSVAFYDGTTLLGTATNAPYQVTANFGSGTHFLTAVATDTNGLSKTSLVTRIDVALPTSAVSIVSPASGGITLSDSNMSLRVTALATSSDPNFPPTVLWSKVSGPGGVTFANLASTDTTVQFSASGNYVLQCEATVGTSVSTAQMQVAVNAPLTATLRQGESGYSHVATFIRGDSTSWNSGARDQILVGRVNSQPLRSLFSFDLAQLDSTAVIQSASLDLWTISTAGVGTVGAVQLRSLNATPVEGTGDGISATNGAGTGATWLSRTGSVAWTSAGGDFGATVLSSVAGYDATVPLAQKTFVSSASFVSAAQAAVNAGAPLNLLALSPTTESGASNAYSRLCSDDGSTVAQRPRLTLTFVGHFAPSLSATIPPVVTRGLPAALGGSVSAATGSVWASLSGPGAVTFTDATVPGTSAIFSEPGSYLLRLTASNSRAEVSRTFSVNVLSPIESWRQTNFGTTSYTGSAGDNADPNNDGIVNKLEFFLARDPLASNPPSSLPAVLRNGAMLEYTYTRSLSAMSQLSHAVEWSDTLAVGSWSSTGVTEQILSDNGTVQQVKASVPAGSNDRRFIHLKVE